MSEDESGGVEPPNDDEMFEDENAARDEMLDSAIQQADQFHKMMDGAKEWARRTATDVRVQQAVEDDEETAAEIGQVADAIESVTVRIERGDNNRARQP